MPNSDVCSVPAELQKILDNLPADEPRSKLEPFRSFILKWRREGRSYRRIQQILRDECKVQVAYETLRGFVTRRVRPRKPQPELETPSALSQQPATQPATERKRLSPEERAAQVEFIRNVRKQPVVVSEPSKPLFEYDPDKPLTLNRSIKN